MCALASRAESPKGRPCGTPTKGALAADPHAEHNQAVSVLRVAAVVAISWAAHAWESWHTEAERADRSTQAANFECGECGEECSTSHTRVEQRKQRMHRALSQKERTRNMLSSERRVSLFCDAILAQCPHE
jgi:hypothetical protein